MLHLQREEDFFINSSDTLKNIALFDTIEPYQLDSLLKCLNASACAYKKRDFVVRAGDTSTSLGIVLEGNLQILKEDILGNRAIIARLARGELFGEALVCADAEKSPVSVRAETDCKILFIDFGKLVTTCSSACVFHTRLIRNMLRIMAQKNMYLSGKIDVLSARSTREKIMAYLLSQAQTEGKSSFEIPFSRDALADYLCVNRSALSRQLGHMRDEGILDFNKNRFSLLKNV